MQDVMERPSVTDEHGRPDSDEFLDSLDLPPGFKAELIEGDIVVTPAPDEEHEAYFVETSARLIENGWRTSGNYGLVTPLGKFQPDLTIARREFFARREHRSYRSPDGVALVVEITSSNPSSDRDSKRRGYAQAKIPLYLLIDRKAERTVLFSEPVQGDYAVADSRPIGEPVPLPEPFAFTLEDYLA
jgi:Uma2 family endonuclease